MKNPTIFKSTLLIFSCVLLTVLGLAILNSDLNADATTTIGLNINTGNITSSGTITSQDLTVQKEGDATLTVYSNTDSPADNSKLLVVQKGIDPSELFSVDEDGDVAIANNLAVSNDLAVTGNVTAGTWQGTPIATRYGGTGQNWSDITQGNLPYFSGTGTLSNLAPGTTGQFLKSQGTGADPEWANVERSAAFVVASNRQQIVTTPSFVYCNDDDVILGANSAWDTSEFYTYPKSIKTTSTDYFTSPGKFSQIYSPAIDLTGCQFHLMCRHDDLLHKKTSIILHAPDFANRITISQSTTQPIVGRWVMKSFSLADRVDTGSPNLATVARIDVFSYADSGETSVAHFDKMFVTKTTKTPTGVVSFVFDDAILSVYETGAQIFDKFGFAATVAVIPKRIDDGLPTYMTLENLKTLQQNGWDMCNHGYNHQFMVGLSAAVCEADVRDGKEWLVENGFGKAADFCVYPNTTIDETALDVIKKYCLLGRGGDSRINTLPVLDKYTLHTYKFDTLTTGECQTLIDKTMANKGWLILYGHDIDAAGDVDPTDLETILEYCQSNNVPVTTMSDVYENYRKW